ncbi:TetR/AcrR family transcriptional regulator [uncultured Mitsuokella sp.]|uniref:TetR/AcrR family transcriptional regulator n=1 Tax=uncultured Mitsuokella sp. TaxID=453120 RepID=UPI002670434C|nr:TetR/AcrR family transcriptional regulator [uncultured Mitsuokella sp.]
MRRKGLTEPKIQSYIVEALLLLLKKKSYGKITIAQIAEKAGVNRSSYYRHFETKEDIIRFFLKGIMEEYQAAYEKRPDKSFAAYMHQCFTTFYAYREDLLTIHRAGLSFLLLDVLEDCFRFQDIPDVVGSPKQFEVSYHIGGIFNNMLLWLRHGMQETPDQMTAIALSFKPEGSFTLLNVKAGQ